MKANAGDQYATVRKPITKRCRGVTRATHSLLMRSNTNSFSDKVGIGFAESTSTPP